MITKLAAVIISFIATVIVFGNSAFAQGVYVSGTVGSDLSWPNCNTKLASIICPECSAKFDEAMVRRSIFN